MRTQTGRLQVIPPRPYHSVFGSCIRKLVCFKVKVTGGGVNLLCKYTQKEHSDDQKGRPPHRHFKLSAAGVSQRIRVGGRQADVTPGLKKSQQEPVNTFRENTALRSRHKQAGDTLEKGCQASKCSGPQDAPMLVSIRRGSPVTSCHTGDDQISLLKPDLHNIPRDFSVHFPQKSAEHHHGLTGLKTSNSAASIISKLSMRPADHGQLVRTGSGNVNLNHTDVRRLGSRHEELHHTYSERTVLTNCDNNHKMDKFQVPSSLHELSRSRDSLLTVDNDRDSGMLIASLSRRPDLVESLQLDGIWDYLSHHGVLDTGFLAGLDKRTTTSIHQLHSAVLEHIEKQGNPAILLLITALRQSWQLELASWLDTEQRITPAPGHSYLDAGRHKGQLTIKIETEALKILSPSKSQPDTSIGTNKLSLSGQLTRNRLDLTDGHLMPDSNLMASHMPYNHLVPDSRFMASHIMPDNDEDFVKPKSCWHFCLFRKSKSKSNKDVGRASWPNASNHDLSQSLSADTNPTLKDDQNNRNKKLHKKKPKQKSKKVIDGVTEPNLAFVSETDNRKTKHNRKKSKLSRSQSKLYSKYSAPDKTDGPSSNQAQELHTLPQQVHVVKTMSNEMRLASDDCLRLTDELDVVFRVGDGNKYTQEHPHTLPHQPYNVIAKPIVTSQGRKPGGETHDFKIVGYNSELGLVTLEAGQASPNNQAPTVGQWRSEGKLFQQTAFQFCDKVALELRTEIIKYIEQELGALVLDVAANGQAVCVVCVCMLRSHVVCLQRNVQDGSLITKMQDLFSQLDSSVIQGVRLRITFEQQEVDIVLKELS